MIDSLGFFWADSNKDAKVFYRGSWNNGAWVWNWNWTCSPIERASSELNYFKFILQNISLKLYGRDTARWFPYSDVAAYFIFFPHMHLFVEQPHVRIAAASHHPLENKLRNPIEPYR